MRHGLLPKNVDVHEFFVQPASELGNAYVQQNYLNSNYTHAARDMVNRGINVLAQTVAQRQGVDGEEFSFSCNPEITLDIMPLIDARRQAGATIITVRAWPVEGLDFVGRGGPLGGVVVVDWPEAPTPIFRMISHCWQIDSVLFHAQ